MSPNLNQSPRSDYRLNSGGQQWTGMDSPSGLEKTAMDSNGQPQPLPESILEDLRTSDGDFMSKASRPGTGGRNPRVPTGVGATVTAASKENSVSPTVIRLGRSGLKWWEVDPDGDGAICARLSSEDENKGVTVMGQIIGGRELASRKDLKPRYVLVAEKQSGKSSIQNHLDIQFHATLW